jgi:sugar lactone lactonase YvrE
MQGDTIKHRKLFQPAGFVGVVLIPLVATLFVSSAQVGPGQQANRAMQLNGAGPLVASPIKGDVDCPSGVFKPWLPSRPAAVGTSALGPTLAVSSASAKKFSTATSLNSPAIGTITTVVGSVGEGPAKSVSVLPNGRVAFRNGAIYFADPITDVVRRVDLATGTETVVAGNGGYGQFNVGAFSAEGGPAVDAELAGVFDVVFDAAGNLYLTDYYNGRVCKVDATGTITTVVGNGQQGGAGVLPWGIVFDQAGNLYISEPDFGDVRKVDTKGVFTTFAARLYNPEGLAVDSTGNVYIADWGANLIRKVDRNGIITTVAGNGTAGYSGDGGPATQANLNQPAGLAFDTAGNMYIADQYNFRLRKVDTSGIITTVAGTGNPGYSGDGGPATSATLWYPSGVGFDDAGNLYISDNTNARVRRVDSNGVITSVIGNGRTRYSGDGGQANRAEMGVPHKLAFDSAGNMFVTIFNIYDIAGAAVRKVDTNGCISTDVTAGIGESGCGNGPTISAALGYPTGVAFDRADNLFIADAPSERVFKVDANGSVTTVAGTGTSGYNGDNIPATQAQLAEPEGLAFDVADNLYIADYNNNRIRKVDTSGTITTVAGNGQAGILGDGLPAIAAELNRPRGVAFDAAGNLYIADYNNSLIRKVDAAASIDGTHHITTVAGNVRASGYSGDGGPATSASLNFPVGVEADSAGNLYIADTENHRIRKVDTSGTITTVAGSGGVDIVGNGGFSGDGGPATSAKLARPYHIAFDAAGDLYFTDSHNYRVRKVTLVRPVQLNAVTSRKTHGSAGTFDINLPLAGTRGVECRSGGVNGDYTLVFTFSNFLTKVGSASVTSGTGAIVSSNIDANDAHNYIVNLTGVTNAQYLTVGLTNVHDSAGNGSNGISASMGVLIGDVNASGRVDAADVSQVRQQTLQQVDSSNFRDDVNASGRIDAADVSIVRQQTLTSLPSSP